MSNCMQCMKRDFEVTESCFKILAHYEKVNSGCHSGECSSYSVAVRMTHGFYTKSYIMQVCSLRLANRQ